MCYGRKGCGLPSGEKKNKKSKKKEVKGKKEKIT